MTRVNNKFSIIFSLIFVVFIIFLRRPDQFLSPFLWQEDSFFILKDYIDAGFSSLLYPVQGYLILSSKVINLISYKISFYYYPELSVVLSISIMLLVFLAIWFSPTVLNYKWLCAMLIFFQPFNPETFSVALYSFWWVGILLILALLWENNEKLYGLKNFYIIISGLSSPLVVGFVPIFILRFFFFRGRKETLSLCLVLFLSLIQLYLIVTTSESGVNGGNLKEILSSADTILTKFFGLYLTNSNYAFLASLVLFFYFLVFAFLYRRDKYLYIYALVLACVIFMSVFRVPFEIIDPVTSGPRYFFYPFILITWSLLYSCGKSNYILKCIGLTLVFFSVLNLLTNGSFTRRHEAVNWKDKVEECMQFDQFFLPFHKSGQLNELGYLELSNNECKLMINSSIYKGTGLDSRQSNIQYQFIPFNSNIDIDKYTIRDVYYRSGSVTLDIASYIHKDILFEEPKTWMVNAVYSKKGIVPEDGFEIIGSYINGDLFKGAQKIFESPRRDVSIVYTTGPSSSSQYIEILSVEDGGVYQLIEKIFLEPSHNRWTSLNISLDRDYGSLEYRIIDDSDQWGEWSAYLAR